MSKLSEDPRIDPRIKALFSAMPETQNPGDATSREELLEEANSEQSKAAAAGMEQFLAMCDTEEIAPSAGLSTETKTFESAPDGNTIKVCMFVRPDNGRARTRACTTSTAVACSRCPASSATTKRLGQASSPPRALRWRWWTFAMRLTPSSAPEIAAVSRWPQRLRVGPASWLANARVPMRTASMRLPRSSSPARAAAAISPSRRG